MERGRLAIVLSALGVIAACSSGTAGQPNPTPSLATCRLPSFGNGDSYRPDVDPSRFGPAVTNPWFPLRPGTKYRYQGLDEGTPAVDVVTVTHRTSVIDGVRARVVFDRLFEHGRVVERTHDYYAQDACGNVWYFGEDTAELDARGVVTSTEGTWHSGVHGAQPGVFMPAHPQPGRRFRQEWYAGHAEDAFSVLDPSTAVRVPAGAYPNGLRTKETSALEPGVIDNKWYAKGVGDVRELTVKGPQERLVLVQVSH